VKNSNNGFLVSVEIAIALVTLVSQTNSCASAANEPTNNNKATMIFFIFIILLIQNQK
jgi:hypothetical protein